MLDAFGEDGVRGYLIGILEGIEDRVEEETEEYEMLEASVTLVVHESSVPILEESEDTLQVWIDGAQKDLSTVIDLYIVDDEDEIPGGGPIAAVEFKDAADHDAGKYRGADQGDAETSKASACHHGREVEVRDNRIL